MNERISIIPIIPTYVRAALIPINSRISRFTLFFSFHVNGRISDFVKTFSKYTQPYTESVAFATIWEFDTRVKKTFLWEAIHQRGYFFPPPPPRSNIRINGINTLVVVRSTREFHLETHQPYTRLALLFLAVQIFFYGKVEVCSFNERGPRTLRTTHLRSVYLCNVIILRTVARNRRRSWNRIDTVRNPFRPIDRDRGINSSVKLKIIDTRIYFF